MKKNIILTSLVLGICTASLLLTSCNKPTERPSAINPGVAANLFALKDLSEITNKAALYNGSDSTEAEVMKMDGSLKLLKIEGRSQDLLNLVKNESTKKELDTQLKNGAVAVVVLDTEIKILKIVKETHSNLDNLNLTSLAYLSKLKKLVLTSDKAQQTGLANELESLKNVAPADLNETFGLSQIAAIKITKHGFLDNEKTDYNEKKSVINLVETSFEKSTHIIVGGEITDTPEEASASLDK